MSKSVSVKKICSFCVSNWHLVTMLTPYISKKIEKEDMIMLLEEDMTEITQEFLSKLSLQKEIKEKVECLVWQKTVCKYAEVKKILKEILKHNKPVNIMIYGTQNYIDKMHENIEKWIKKNIENLEDRNIQIVDAYEVMQFNHNLNDILDKHDKILNTSGEKEIEEVFDGYQNKTKKIV